jgi:hypothetical protein
MKKLLVLALYAGVLTSVWANTNPLDASDINNPRKPKARPSLPGNLVWEFGTNMAINSPAEFNLAWFGSRSFNFYYQFEKRIGSSKFAFAPGVGLGSLRYKFSNNYTLAYETDISGVRSVQLEPANPSLGGIKKSMLITNYVDIPLEFRFYTNPEDVNRSFHVSLGGYFGLLFDSKTKIKNSENRLIKDKQNYDLNYFRYGASMRIGVGGFNFFGRYSLSPLFQPGKTPGEVDFTTMTLGFSVIGF